jgi:hypothetical protein
LEERYQENFLNVTIQEKIQALKNRYAMYEKIMEQHLLKQYGMKYSRVHVNDLSNETQFLMIGYLRAIEEDGRFSLDSFMIDCLSPNDSAYSLRDL